jgi:hypothetical protein
MKKLVFTIMIALVAVTVNAQRIGIRGGLNLSNMDTEDDTKTLAGFNAGIIGELPLSENFFLNAAILYTQNGAKIEDADLDLVLNNLELPVNLAYKFGAGAIRPFIQAGPYVAYGLNAKITNGDEEEELEYGDGDNEVTRMDIGVNVGAGLDISKFQVLLNYGLGFTDLSGSDDSEYKNRQFSISLGYFF